MPKTPQEDLPIATELCQQVITSIAASSIRRFAFQAPVIDRQTNLPYDDPLSSSFKIKDKDDAHHVNFNKAQQTPSNSKDRDSLWKNAQPSKCSDRKGLTVWSQGEILGWNRFIAGIEKQKAHLDQHGDANKKIALRPELIRESPLPSVQSTATLWKQILVADTPVTGVRAVMRASGNRMPRDTVSTPSNDISRDASGATSPDLNGPDSPEGREVGKRQARRTKRAVERYGENDDRTLRVVGGSQVVANGHAGKGKAKAKDEEVVVDVIARGGAEWIKIYTKKESQLLAEFREQDSYITSDWSDPESESDHDSNANHCRSMSHSSATASRTRQHPALTNSIIEMARSLLNIAAAHPRPPGAATPFLTMRFTRMSRQPISDEPRIAETFELLERMGIRLAFGDLSDRPMESLLLDLPKAQEEEGLRGQLLPSLKVNLDPTALVGLCCDLLHHGLHSDVHEARRRYFRPRRYLHQEDGESGDCGKADPSAACSDEHESKDTTLNGRHESFAPVTKTRDDNENDEYLNGYDDHAQSQHSRELFKEAMEERHAPLIEELRDLLAASVSSVSRQTNQPFDRVAERIEWFATPEAIRHLKEAMSNTKVVGEGREQMRMRRLIGLEEGDFFEGSRYEGQEGVLRGIRIKVLANRASDSTEPSLNPQRSFHVSMARACQTFLAEYNTLIASASPNLYPSDLPPFLRPDRLPVPKVASLTLPLPIVSLRSMQRGAEEGMTTLSMGNVVFRELWREGRWKPRGWTQGNWELERAICTTRTKRDQGHSGKDEHIGQVPGAGNAVMWLMPYRSLGEGKRVRFENGDYTFPTAVEG